ncbi:DUF2075 domain-containing protein [Loigolactobacillus iwatensis]|uniref:DUF2075 domain-containing protein n=1 Tax=Loigolactobacillus iwatensis TaxID=1267156 RepID=UPI000F7F51D8|nr:DUF2075 domain-containing protein [Loigolactobacillus iwatensis]
MAIKGPIIKEVTYSENFTNELDDAIGDKKIDKKLLIDYPTVYIIRDKDRQEQYTVYVGETTNINRRTNQHLYEDPAKRLDWDDLSNAKNARLFVIGHDHFNKSLTLDIENQLMMYLLSVDNIKQLNNRRTNAQNLYYTSDEMQPIFSKIWRGLHKFDQKLFPLESIIRDSALFKASPFHKLTEEQVIAKRNIAGKIEHALKQSQAGQLIFVEGEAGSGKTVLLSNLFYELNSSLLDQQDNKEATEHVNPRSYLLVNHEQQLTVYKQIAKKLGLIRLAKDIVSKPTHFINEHTGKPLVDIVLVDEAHLLWTQGKMSYRGKNQLKDLLKLAKVVVIVFDRHQILTTEEYWDEKELLQLEVKARDRGNLIHLKDQKRIVAGQPTIDWIRKLVFDRTISKIPLDSAAKHGKGYQLKIAEDPESLYDAIKSHSREDEVDRVGISRMLATFDWKYNQKGPENGDYWRVKAGDLSLPWNLEIPQTRTEKRKNRGLSWAEQPQTIQEAGSTYTIQGFDLNYAGVIIGPSVKFRQGKVIFDPDASQNKKATQKRTTDDGKKIVIAEDLLQNELNVLLTRGVHGLFIYAVDPELQQALLNAADKDHLIK